MSICIYKTKTNGCELGFKKKCSKCNRFSKKDDEIIDLVHDVGITLNGHKNRDMNTYWREEYDNSGTHTINRAIRYDKYFRRFG